MIQSRTHNCNELRLSDAGKNVTIVGWYENIRKVSKNLGFLILRDFYGTTQVVIETEEMMQVIDSVNKERLHPGGSGFGCHHHRRGRYHPDPCRGRKLSQLAVWLQG